MGAAAIKGWWSQVMASLSFRAWSVTSKMEYSMEFPAVGARMAAFRMACFSSGPMGRFSNTRTDFRSIKTRSVSFMAVPPYILNI